MQYNIKFTFTEDLLGTAPMDEEVYSTFIASRAPAGEAADEIDTISDGEKGKTGFHKLDGQPILYDYVIKGFLKDACGMLRRNKETRSSKLTSYKKVIDGLVFVTPRRIPIQVVGEIGELQRPLRAQTAQGERVALAASECIQSGSSITFTLVVLDDKSVPEKLLCEWLEYGAWRGLGQWRNASYGRFHATITATA